MIYAEVISTAVARAKTELSQRMPGLVATLELVLTRDA